MIDHEVGISFLPTPSFLAALLASFANFTHLCEARIHRGRIVSTVLYIILINRATLFLFLVVIVMG